MAAPGQTVLRIVCLSNGASTPVDGCYVVEYDPRLTWVGGDRTYVLDTTPDIRNARGFADTAEAFEYYNRICPNEPTRPLDAKPNRPLTAYTVEFARVPRRVPA